MYRTLSDAETDDLLSLETFGHLACYDGKRPYIIPLAYVYHDGVLYGQTTEGKKTDLLRKNPQVCFQVQRQDGNTWRSVMCWGAFEELELERMDRADAKKVSKILSDYIASIQKGVGVSVKFSFEDKVAPLSVDGRTSTIFRIVVEEKSGRVFAA